LAAAIFNFRTVLTGRVGFGAKCGAGPDHLAIPILGTGS
jgi:hypothetical protein